MQKIYLTFFSLFSIFLFLPIGKGIENISIFIIALLTIYSFYKRKICIKDMILQKEVLLYLLFIFSMILSIIFAYDSWDALHEYKKNILNISILFISVLVFKKNISIDFIFRLATFIAMCVVIYFYYHYYNLTGLYNPFSLKGYRFPGDALKGMLSLLPFSLYAYIYYYKKNQENISYLFFLSAIIVSIFIVLHGSRSGYLSIALIYLIFTMVLISIFKVQIKTFLYTKKFLLLLVTFVFLSYSISQTLIFQKTFDRAFSKSYRDVLFSITVPIIKDNFLFGIGSGDNNRDNIIKKYNIKEQCPAIVYTVNNKLYYKAENTYNSIWLEYGVFTFIIYILILYNFLIKSFKNYNSQIKETYIYMAFFSMILANNVIRYLFADQTIYHFLFILILFIIVTSQKELNKKV